LTTSLNKSKELTPWLSDCPSQILRNSSVNWYQTYWKFIKGECGKPKRKRFKDGEGSIHLTRELFSFETCDDGNIRLFIGSKRNNIGYLSIKRHANFQLPKSIYIRRKNDKFWVSFCYGETELSSLAFNKENLKYLNTISETYLNVHVVGIDRGVAIPVQCGNDSFDFTSEQKSKKIKHARYIKRLQRQLSKKQKGSFRHKRCKQRLARRHEQVANIRKDFCHQTSFKIITNKQNKIIDVVKQMHTPS
jgi:putative transposase